MLLTIATNRAPATDLGFLLHKHPARLQEFKLNFGRAQVFYPAADDAFTQMAMVVDVDRDWTGSNKEAVYISDRSYVAGSFLPTAISKVFGTALSGRCEARPELPTEPLQLLIEITPVASRGHLSAHELFEPLGWTVTEDRVPLDREHPEWDSLHRRITLHGQHRLQDALRHLCVLLPVMDGQRHYFIGEAEIEKLQRYGDGWLDTHPHVNVIVRRYLRFRNLVTSYKEDITVESDDGTEVIERQPSLQQRRIKFATEHLIRARARRVVDLGCGEGDLITALLNHKRFSTIIGVDPSIHSLQVAGDRLHLNRMVPAQRSRVRLMQGASSYADTRLQDVDAVALLEVIEHLEPWALQQTEVNVFDRIRPDTVIITTPNREWNESILLGDSLRHKDHRFEWTRYEFRTWAENVADRYGYQFEWHQIGTVDAGLWGAPTQAGVFSLKDWDA